MIVYVKREHIVRGERWSNTHCPVALALKNATGEELVSIEEGRPIVGEEVIALSEKTWKFVSDFDNGKKVKPFNFRIKWPKKSS